MSTNTIIVIVVIVVILVAGYFIFRQPSTQNYTTPTQQTNANTNTQVNPVKPATTEQSPAPTENQNQNQSAAAATSTSVSIMNFAFSPAQVTIKAGGTVKWTNQDSPTHTITSDNNTFTSGNLATGQSFQFTFATAGTYTYHCSIHPSMTGTVVVQ